MPAVYVGLNRVGDDGDRCICAWSEITVDQRDYDSTYLSRDNRRCVKMEERRVRMLALRSICILMIYVCGVYSTEFVPVFMWESSR
jgi:hypothetical protein